MEEGQVLAAREAALAANYCPYVLEANARFLTRQEESGRENTQVPNEEPITNPCDQGRLRSRLGIAEEQAIGFLFPWAGKSL